MDSVIITAAVILAVVAIIEIVTLFISLPTDNVPPYVNVLPVFGDDKFFDKRLEYLMQKGCGRRNAILVDYTATPKQKELCNIFVQNNPDAIFIPHTQLREIFSKTFSDSEK